MAYIAQAVTESFQSTWRNRPINGRRKPRLLLNPIQRNPVLLPPRQAGHVAIAGIPQVNRVLKRRNTNTCAPQQTVPRGERLRNLGSASSSQSLPTHPTMRPPITFDTPRPNI